MQESDFTPYDEARMILGKISDAIGFDDSFPQHVDGDEDAEIGAGGWFEIVIADSEDAWKHKKYRITVEAV